VAQARVRSARKPALDVNALVRITLAGTGERPLAVSAPSRVEDLDIDPATGLAASYLVAAPSFAGDLERPPAGSPVELEWLTERGLCSLPARYEAAENGPLGLRLWRLKVTGTATRHERRRYVRAPWSLPAALVVRDGAGSARVDVPDLPEAYAATAVNVSEGGLLCMSPVPAMPAGLPLLARFTIGESAFEIPSTVVWSILRMDAGGPRAESAIEFDDPSRHGDKLRPLIFQEQLRLRRAGLA
jgi:hypothetical protein